MPNDTIQKTDLTQAQIILSLSKDGLAYQQLLQDAENIKVTRDNINQERLKVTILRKLKTKIEGLENPHTAAWADWNEKRRSLLTPVKTILAEKEGDVKLIADELAEENRKAEADKQRKAGINQAIDTFFLEQSQAIAAAKTPEELVRIEKLIGSHKANSSRYGEFLPLMVQKASNLTELIKVQKEAIKILTALNRKEMASGDDAEILELREQQEQIQATLEQTKINVQEAAISMATEADVVEPEVVVADAPKPRRQSWTWDVVNIKETQKKMPAWVILTVDIPKVDEYLRVKKAEGFDGEEFEFAGIRFFLQKSY